MLEGCTSSQWVEISPQYLQQLTAKMPKVCKAVIAANGKFLDECKFDEQNSSIKRKIMIVNALTIISDQFNTALVNKIIKFSQMHETFWLISDC